jgi:hypothetical protein
MINVSFLKYDKELITKLEKDFKDYEIILEIFQIKYTKFMKMKNEKFICMHNAYRSVAEIRYIEGLGFKVADF